ncbi:NUMOD4 motif-containing HNH endonuclease [Pseudomonas chlororaphis]|uniref:NUMOD4 motif-containing HNH endonuclease n=1 Tax=Pseudomonas chlororaphis TaxID=587753 RepID=UPI001E44E25F|nr:NUMOD4 motif-containing HNH endonuclease [Pseudomonas chlororaphis]MCB2253447.1 NUMOD4 motif-containing HNH endonuclease [Pseudomonas chlororaphis]
MDDAEQWKTIPGHESYEVSSLGRFRSIPRHDIRGQWRPQRYLAQKPDKDGYLIVAMDGGSHRAHRLVALAFHGPSDLPIVNHINGEKDDNRPENLEWCTISENVRHAINSGLIVYGVGLQSRVHKGWIQAECNGFGLMLRGHRDLVAVGMNPSVVTSCLKGRRRTHKGFAFSRVDTQL